MARDESRPALLVSPSRPAVPAAQMMEDDVRDNMAALRSRQVRSVANSIESEVARERDNVRCPRARGGEVIQPTRPTQTLEMWRPPHFDGATRSQVAAAKGAKERGGGGGGGGSRFSPPALFWVLCWSRASHTALATGIAGKGFLAQLVVLINCVVLIVWATDSQAST